MGIRRALVVDDSKVARAQLAKMLAKHGVLVDTSESAEAALDYLLTHKPDVIFLDHIMPGMDGFQAMRAIKRNPDTATIPIMMYTSREGELYVSQARALGAVGRLPKQVQPAQVKEILDRLEQMHVPDEERLPTAVNDEFPAPGSSPDKLRDRVQKAVGPAESDALQLALERSFSAQRRALRHDIDAGFEKSARALIEELGVHGTPDTGNGDSSNPRWKTLLLIAALLLPSLVLLQLYFNVDAARDQLDHQYQRLVSRQASLQASVQRSQTSQDNLAGRYQSLVASSQNMRNRAMRDRALLLEMVAWAMSSNPGIDFGQELPDESSRQTIRDLVEQLDQIGYQGVVQISLHHGDFCLQGDASSGYRLASPDLDVSACSIGLNPLAQAGADTMALEQLLNNELTTRGSGLRIAVLDLGMQQARTLYPPMAAVASAGEWNAIARHNNRIEVALLPDG